MTRRDLLTSMSLLVGSRAARAGPGLKISATRLRGQLESLSVCGRPAGGNFSDGVSRIGYSDADLAGRKYLLGLVEAAHLKARIDAAGNIFVRKGRQRCRTVTRPVRVPYRLGTEWRQL